MGRARQAGDAPARMGDADAGLGRVGEQETRRCALGGGQHQTARRQHADRVQAGDHGAERSCPQALFDRPQGVGGALGGDEDELAGIEPEPDQARSVRQAMLAGGAAGKHHEQRPGSAFATRRQGESKRQRVCRIAGRARLQFMQAVALQPTGRQPAIDRRDAEPKRRRGDARDRG